jgi:hypothetical protein
MDIAKLFALADRYKDVPGMAHSAVEAASAVATLIGHVMANHARAQRILSQGERAELDAVHAETLAAIDAFDAELAKAAS